jgi:UDP-N-acetylmuramoyl-tripeptide--D-alanyl-D-alanine ligase
VYFPDAAKSLQINLALPNSPQAFSGASIDTRTIQPGNLFIAFKGEKSDGHLFLDEAFRKGASGALVDRRFFEAQIKPVSPSLYKNLLPVENVQEALTQLATIYRASLKLKAAAITGSVGKTSTKEFLSYLLRQKYSVLSNEGNFNNHLGLPLTIFRMKPEHEVAVCELGANHVGEIRFLSTILKPDIAAITCVAPCHLEGFGSLEKIYQAKLELFESLSEGAPAILGDEDPVLIKQASRMNLKFIKVGESAQADYRFTDVRVEQGSVSFLLNGKKRFSFPGIAAFLVKNAAMAIAVAEAMGVSLAEMPEAWVDIKMPAGRFQEQTLFSGVRVIFDGYNASPASFAAALTTFDSLRVEGRKILVFADMLELGNEEKSHHTQLGVKIAQCRFDNIVAYGDRSKFAIDAIRVENPTLQVHHFENAEQAALYLKDKIQSGDALLLKASRGMKIETILKTLQDQQLSGIQK